MAGRPNDDLFEGSKMSFGSHLEELRVMLFRAIFGIVIGMVLGLFVANKIVRFIQKPLTIALEEYHLDRAKEKLAKQYQENIPAEFLETITKDSMIPTVSRLEPQGLWDAIILLDPELAKHARYKPHRIIPADLLVSQREFSQQMVQAGSDNKETPGKRLWTLLTPKQQQQLRGLSKKETDGTEANGAVVALLNELIDTSKLNETKEFSKLTLAKGKDFNLYDISTWFYSESSTKAAFQSQIDRLREQMGDTIGNEQTDPNKSRHLNRMLLAVAFPDLVRLPRVNLVNVPSWKPIDIRVQTLNAQEAFMIWLKAGFIGGLVISSPWIFWQVWMFVAAGLYPHEKRYVYVFLPFSLTLFFLGTALAFTFVFQPVLHFLFSFNMSMDIDPDPRISEWMSFVLFLPLGFGVAFQLPLVMLFINRIGILSTEMYMQKWRIAILVIFVLSMFLTPADPISMLLMAAPLTLLYFLGVALCSWMPRGRNPFDNG